MSSRNSINICTDIKADNILIEIEDQGLLKAFVDAEMASPSPRKIIEGKPIYATRQFGLPKNMVVLSLETSALQSVATNLRSTTRNRMSTAVQRLC